MTPSMIKSLGGPKAAHGAGHTTYKGFSKGNGRHEAAHDALHGSVGNPNHGEGGKFV